jgi:hypothetical protein
MTGLSCVELMNPANVGSLLEADWPEVLFCLLSLYAVLL